MIDQCSGRSILDLMGQTFVFVLLTLQPSRIPKMVSVKGKNSTHQKLQNKYPVLIYFGWIVFTIGRQIRWSQALIKVPVTSALVKRFDSLKIMIVDSLWINIPMLNTLPNLHIMSRCCKLMLRQQTMNWRKDFGRWAEKINNYIWSVSSVNTWFGDGAVLFVL